MATLVSLAGAALVVSLAQDRVVRSVAVGELETRPLDSLERLERLELVCMWFEGAAVQGRWRGELGEALTGRRVNVVRSGDLGFGSLDVRLEVLGCGN